MVSEDVIALIDEGTVTTDDFNALIETTYKSARERVRRVTEPIDHNRRHDSDGHGLVPDHAGRTVPRRGGGRLNDPRRTARGKAMLRRQRARNENIDPVEEIATKWYRPDGSPRTRIMQASLVKRISEDYGVSVAEAQELLRRVDQKLGIKESKDQEGKLARAMELVREYAPEDELYTVAVLWHEAESKIHISNGDWAEYDTGGLYDALEKLLGKGKVSMEAESGPGGDESEWEDIPYDYGQADPESKFDEAVEFIRQYQGKPITEAELTGLSRPDELERLTVRLMRESWADRDWLWELHRLLTETDLRAVGTALGTLGANIKQIAAHSREEAQALVQFFRDPAPGVWDQSGKQIIGGIIAALKDKVTDPEELAQLVELAGLPGASIVAALFDVPDTLARRSLLRKWDIPDRQTKALKALLGPRGFTAIINVFVKFPALKDRLIKLLLSVAGDVRDGSEELAGGNQQVRRRF